MWDDVENIKRRLVYYDYDEIIDMLGISVEDLVERFDDRINEEKLYYLVEEEESSDSEHDFSEILDDDSHLFQEE